MRHLVERRDSAKAESEGKYRVPLCGPVLQEDVVVDDGRGIGISFRDLTARKHRGEIVVGVDHVAEWSGIPIAQAGVRDNSLARVTHLIGPLGLAGYWDGDDQSCFGCLRS